MKNKNNSVITNKHSKNINNNLDSLIKNNSIWINHFNNKIIKSLNNARKTSG